MKNNSGLTLIEVAILMLLLGFFVTPLLALLHVERQAEVLKRTEGTPIVIQAALQRYVLREGRYPRPANRNVSFTDANFGMEAPDIAFPACAAGSVVVCVTNGNRDLPTDVDTTISNNPPEQILIGDVPYAALGLPLYYHTDGEGSKFTYAVSRGLTGPILGVAVPGGFSDSNGEIRLLDAGGGNHSNTASNLHYIIIAHGENQKGAFGEGGTLIAACNGQGADLENCDNDGIFNSNFAMLDRKHEMATGDAEYLNQRNYLAGNSYYDDYEVFTTTTATDIWTRTVGGSDLYYRNAEEVRIGLGPLQPRTVGAGTTLFPASAKLYVRGNVIAETAVHVSRICDPGVGNCATVSLGAPGGGLVPSPTTPAKYYRPTIFTPSVIAGPISTTNKGKSGGGIACADHVPLIGISGVDEICGTSTTSVPVTSSTRSALVGAPSGQCPAGQWPRGTDGSGRFVCAAP